MGEIGEFDELGGGGLGCTTSVLTPLPCFMPIYVILSNLIQTGTTVLKGAVWLFLVFASCFLEMRLNRE